VSRRRTDNTRVHQYPWVEDRQTIQEFINIYSRILIISLVSVCLLLKDIDYLFGVCLSSTQGYWLSLWCLSVFYSRILIISLVSVSLLLKDIDELLYCLSVFYSRILMNSCIVCLSSTHGYWWTLVLSVRLLLTYIDELLYCLSVLRTDNTRVHQYPWVEDGQTIQEFINICE
jgi:hypothetical protein